MRWLPRIRVRHPERGSSSRPDATCPRCGASAPAGHVVATARGHVRLGWVDGEPGVQLWGDVELDDGLLEPARLPGYRCRECALLWLEL